MRQLLLIEDEPNFARFVQLELEHEGYRVTVSHDGREGMQTAAEKDWDIILLDLMLPGISGIEICRRLRSQNCRTPVIMLTARDTVMDRVAGLDSGADDYIPKPFAIEELLARMRALFRRLEGSSADDGEPILYQDLVVDLPSRTVTQDGASIDFTKREFDLLLALMSNKNTVMTRDRLLNEVWGYDAGIETNVVDVYIRYVRQKLEGAGKDKEQYIQTVRGVGYVMKT